MHVYQMRSLTILGLGFMVFVFGMTWLSTQPETNVTKIHKLQDRIQFSCPEEGGEH